MSFRDPGDPTADNDETEGFEVEGEWRNTTTEIDFVCKDATAGAAVWETVPVPPHTVASHIDTDATGAQLNQMTDGSNSDDLHTHDSLALLAWKFRADTGAGDPGGGRFRMNDAVPANVTALYFDEETDGGFNINNLFGQIIVGEQIAVQQADDPGKVVLFEVSSAPTNNTGWWTIPVTVLDSIGTVFGVNKSTVWAFKFGGFDASSLHINRVGEFVALATKSVLVAGDKLIIEDSEAGGAKAVTSPADVVASFPPAAHNHDASDINAGTLDDARVAESNVTQHQAAVDHDALTNFEVGEHRVINDAGTGTTELWSADKINAELVTLLSGSIRKPGVQTSTTGLGNITLSGEQTLNGVLTSTSVVLVTEQTLPEDNGFYVTAAGAWARASFADEDAEVTNGNLTDVLDTDSTKFGYKYLLVTPDPIVVGTTGQTWEEHRSIDFGTVGGTAAEGNDTRIPTQDENDAMVGTSGAASSANKFVTDADTRNSDARTPTAHNHDASDIDAGTFDDDRVAESNVTQHEAAIDHDALANFNAGEHRAINDAGSAATDLWSAEKIAAAIAAAIQPVENAILVMRRTTTLTFPASWADMTFDSTVEETNAAVIEHVPGGANPERLVFQRAGNYRVSYSLVGDQPSGDTLESRLLLNGSTVVIGSEDRAGPGTHNQVHIANLGRSILISIDTPGDYLALQIQNTSTGGAVLANAVLTANALTGI